MDVFLTGTPKKLLIAITIVAIITMCIMPSEARSLEHKKRHGSHRGIARTTKDNLRLQNRRSDGTLHTKEPQRKPKNPKAEFYVTQFNKIMRKVRNTRNHYNNDWKVLQPHLQAFREVSRPNWLPNVSFVDIHDTRRDRRSDGTTIPERKYIYQVPKLYKSLLDFYDLFKQLEAFRLNFPDDPYNTYKRNRRNILKTTIANLYSTIQEVKDSMDEVKLNVSIPEKRKRQLDLNVDSTQCLKNDYLAFRAYGNMLQNWYLELRCRGKKHVTRSMCQSFFEKLKMKSSNRNVKTTNRDRSTTRHVG